MPRRNTKKTNEEFIREARAVHGDNYDYTACHYAGAHKKLTVICRVHGRFDISANSHLRGRGCMLCNGGGKLSASEYCARARAVHGRRYKYGPYTGISNQIKITCKHGPTLVKASSHLTGAECPQCRQADRSRAFILQARKVHRRRYDYSLCRFEHCDRKVKIICRVHGVFLQSPHNHLRHHGCPQCSRRSRIQ